MSQPSSSVKYRSVHTYYDMEFDTVGIERNRQWLVNSKLLGNNPHKYGGLDYGNISTKSSDGTIIISGTQTSHFRAMSYECYAMITGYDLNVPWICSTGMSKPSSEALTHLAIYDCDSQLGAVIHVHSPYLWLRNDLLRTDKSAEYGSQEMVSEVQRLFVETDVRDRGIFIMAGHEDGVMVFGKDLSSAVNRLIEGTKYYDARTAG
jgi:L-ribulose-5-phosphate 4-epimerase